MAQRRPPKGRRPSSEADWSKGERIAKYLARAGVASRRRVEGLIEEGLVSVDGVKLTSPAFKVTGREHIKVGGRIIEPPAAARLWRYHKPSGLITANKDPEGRRTIFQELPKALPRVVTVGRLDLTTEGLLLLTTDGQLARHMELPATGLVRTYRARAHGRVTEAKLKTLADGVTVDGIRYAPIEAELDVETGTNNWLNITLREGKNREVRKALDAVDLMVNRLIRITYGPFELGDLRPGAIDEVAGNIIAAEFGEAVDLTGHDAGKRLGERAAHGQTNRKGRPPRRGPPRKRNKR